MNVNPAKLRLGILGVGHFGRFHALKAAANPAIHLIGLHDAAPDRAAQIAGEVGAPALSPDAVIAAALAQTETNPAQASLRQDGRYRVVLASVGTPPQADREVARLGELGYPLDVLPQPAEGQTRYRLVIGGLPDHAQARRLVLALKQRLGVTGWVLVPE